MDWLENRVTIKINYMRHRFLILTFFAGLLLVSCNVKEKGADAEQENEDGVPVMDFVTLEHDFGDITEGEKVACVFKFTNSGDADLLISSVTTSCGCTIPDFDKKPVQPGDSGTIEVLFDSSYREGAQTKTVTVRSNASVKVMVLRITAEVEKADNNS